MTISVLKVSHGLATAFSLNQFLKYFKVVTSLLIYCKKQVYMKRDFLQWSNKKYK
jgi:hypothetical protein